MARTHSRKLFPSNQTQECSSFCDPDCSYNCYPFPDLYLPPPPPTPPISSPSNQISAYLIILASLFTVTFVLVAFYVIKIKCYADWCGWRGNGSRSSQSDSSEEELFHENQVDHPVWLITTVGLKQSIIDSITACKFRKDEGLIEGTDCSVCLNEFQEDETLRLLPKCNHAFHIPCIDTWLRSHINCPLCRADIVSFNVSPEAAMLDFSSNVGRSEDTQIEVSEDRGGTIEAGEAQEFSDESILKEGSDVDVNHEILNHEIPREMSFVPMNLPSDSVQDETEGEGHMFNLVKKDGGKYSTLRRSSFAQFLHLSPISMKRSISCSGRVLPARGSRTLNSSLILIPY